MLILETDDQWLPREPLVARGYPTAIRGGRSQEPARPGASVRKVAAGLRPDFPTPWRPMAPEGAIGRHTVLWTSLEKREFKESSKRVLGEFRFRESLKRFK